MNNISFQGRSNIILNTNTYDKAMSSMTGAHRNLTNKSTCKLVNGKFFTANANANNIAVILRNGKSGYIKHVPVSEDKPKKIINEILQKIDELKNGAKEKLTALIIGGDGINKPNGNKTITTVNDIADVICDRPDIDASILAGSKTGEDKFVLHTLKDKTELILDKPNISAANLEDKLEKYFDIVELNNIDLPKSK